MNSLYYVVFLEPPANRGIFERQLRPFRNQGYKLWCFCPAFEITRNFKLRKVSSVDYDPSLFDRVISIPAPSYFGYPGPIAFLYLILMLLYKKSSVIDLFKRGVTVRCRNLVFPLLVRLTGGESTLYCDARGVLHDEAHLLKRPKLSVRFMYWMEKRSLRHVDGLSAVTAGLASYCRAIGFQRRIDLNPPFVGDFKAQRKIRASAPISRVVFLGTLSPWNDIVSLEQLFKRYSNIQDILFLGNSTQQQQAVIEATASCEVFFKSVQPTEVSSVLAHYDYGLILGSASGQSLTDRTMVPSKLYEYAEAGLVPIVPCGCKSTKKFLRKRDLLFLEF